MKRIAIPTVNGHLSAHFGHSQEFHVFEVEGSEILKKESHTPPPHAPGIIPKWVGELKANDVIAGGMGQRAIDLFNMQGINVHVGAPILPSEELVKAFINGELKTQANMCDH